MKKPTSSVLYVWNRKTEPNRTQTEKTKKNRGKPVWTGFCPNKLNRNETSRFKRVSVFFLIRFGYFFFDKNWSEPKIRYKHWINKLHTRINNHFEKLILNYKKKKSKNNIDMI